MAAKADWGRVRIHQQVEGGVGQVFIGSACPLSVGYNIILPTVMVNPFILKDAKYVLLTYAQCGSALHGQQIVSHLFDNHGAASVVYREQHVDGGEHLHAFVVFERKFSSRNTAVFDVAGFHPNIERVSTWALALWLAKPRAAHFT